MEFILSLSEGFEMTNADLVVIPRGRLCENTVHGSTRLTTNGVVSLEIEYLSVRPEHRRRAPREFSHSLAERGIFLDVKDSWPIENEPLPKDFVDGLLRRRSGQADPSVTVESSSTTCTDDGLKTAVTMSSSRWPASRKTRRSTSATNSMAPQSRVIR